MNRYKFINENKEHLHTLDGKPLIGTTTVLKELAKPLTWWASGLAVEKLGWTNSKKVEQEKRLEIAGDKKSEIERMSTEEYLKLLDKAYRAHADRLDESADAGVDMHEELEKYVKMCIETNEGKPIEITGEGHEAVILFSKWAKGNVEQFIVSEGNAYSESLWVGGILDLLYEDRDRRLVILDFKSSKEAYFSQFLQTAGNDIEIHESGIVDKDGNQLLDLKGRPVDYYAVFPFGGNAKEPTFYYNTEVAKEGFKHVVAIYKIIKKYGN